MSKAFTRESDDAPEEILKPQRLSPLPPGVKNYITPEGAERLRKELTDLVEIERPRALNASEGADRNRELQKIEQRIASLTDCLQTIEVVPPPATSDDQIRFGANVLVRDKTGEESNYRLVGVDETDLDRGWISWRSPLARALLNARPGNRVRFRNPAGEEELHIISVTYGAK